MWGWLAGHACACYMGGMIRSVLIANRGEVAIRVARACAGLGVRSVAVFGRDDAGSLHVRRADEAHALPGVAAAAYLDEAALVAAARAAGCDAVHPGYGFLSENSGFAAACEAARLVFVGPRPETLALLGDKALARGLAVRCGVAVPRGTEGAVSEAAALRFLEGLGEQGAVMVKAVAGGGGRGMRVVRDVGALPEAWARCRAEALAAFGQDGLYVEELIEGARHIEVQVAGDGEGGVCALGDRDCSVQRRHQKLIEIAPSPNLAGEVRERLAAAALAMAREVGLRSLCTFEFLLRPDGQFVFIEANPRLQVEHTVTEEAFGIDLVAAQLRLAGGATVGECGLAGVAARQVAVQARVNLEAMQADGGAWPQSEAITVYEPPAGPGLRVDGAAHAGYAPSPAFDTLAAKVIARADDFGSAARLAGRALGEFRLEGPQSNIGFLRAILGHADFLAGAVTTAWVDAHAAELLGERAAAPGGDVGDAVVVRAPAQGRVVSVDVVAGDLVRAGQQVCVLEAMKMQIVVVAPVAGVVREVAAQVGTVVAAGAVVAAVAPAGDEASGLDEVALADPDAIRGDLAALRERVALTLDAARPEAMARRRAQGGRSARENVDDLLDAGSFREYGALAVAAQRTRRPLEDLQKSTPADGLVCGIGTIGAAEVGPERATTLVAAYDYTVLAGTQGAMNHKKTDRLFGLAAELKRPLVLLAEGGGGRPGDTDTDPLSAGGLDLSTFAVFAGLSGLVPLVGVVHGSCFAGNAALLGCCDVIISTRASNTGMGGPAMIEGGGLGSFRAAEIGPAASQWANGVIDVLVEDEAAAVRQARRYVGYFQGAREGWACADQRLLRMMVPEARQRAYEVRGVIEGLCDTGSVLELRGGFGAGMVTALARIGGRPVGVMANNPLHLGGAIDAAAADKGARFLGLCDAHGLPVVSLCDTPGFMVGPESEREANVRHACRLFLRGANLSVPVFTVVLRKGYGLGAMAMAAGGFHRPVFTISWPSGEFGPMGLEGAVRLGYRRELAAIADPAAREAERERLTAALYARGRAVSAASMLEIDAVIDPAETRDWLLRGLAGVVVKARARRFVDSW
jgi:acetyl/propionyl-CoA carboxylase alpha subunit/acetyl-CoA carboxylase carboxyltransferase component